MKEQREMNLRSKATRPSFVAMVAATITAVLWFGAAPAQGTDSATDNDDLVPLTYTETQARQGRAVFGGMCGGCHGDNLEGLDGPPLIGDSFVERWSEGPVADLFDYIMTTMPADRPGTLTTQRTAMLVALIADRNGFEPGEEALPEDPEVLAEMGLKQ